jgi:hypothetical protein
MSSTAFVTLAEATGLLIARETSLGTQPTAGWQTLQPNAGKLSNFYLHTVTKAREPLTKQRQMEAPEIVDANANPGVGHDLLKDLIDATADGWLLTVFKGSGGTGTAYWSNTLATATITARTSTAYTVTAGGALQAGTLVVPRGWVTGANATANGTLQVVGAASSSTSITVASGVAETPAGAYPVTLEVAGFRGASGDIQIDGSGDIISTVADFTTMGLSVGQWLWVGGTAGGATAFATAAYRGFAKIKGPITATKIPLERRSWTVGSADTGSSKTIDLYWGRWIRNVAFGHADYLMSSYQMELTYTGLSGGTVDEYIYAAGNVFDQVKFNIGEQALVDCDLSFIGTTITKPATTRATGASTAAAPLAIQSFNSVNKVLREKVAIKATDVVVADDIESAGITIMNHVTPQKQHGTLGTKRDVVGKVEASADLTVALTQDDAIKACQDNTTLTYDIGLRNDDMGMLFDMPSCKCTDAPPSFPANGPVSLALKLAGFRDATGNYTVGISLFPFLPTA